MSFAPGVNGDVVAITPEIIWEKEYRLGLIIVVRKTAHFIV